MVMSDKLQGTKYAGITKGDPRWKMLTKAEQREMNALAGGALVGKRRTITKEDIDNAENDTLRENLKQELPNVQSRDDTTPNDVSPSDATRLGLPFTRVRDYEDYRIFRDTRFGMWTVLGLESIGRYTSLQEAQKGLTAYLEKQRKEANAE
jgi:hypothetical protein